MPPRLPAALSVVFLTLTSACAATPNAAHLESAHSPVRLVTAPRAAPGATPEIGDLLDLVDIGTSSKGAMTPSPDGRHIALIQSRMQLASNAYTRELVLIDVASGVARVVAGAGGFILAEENGIRAGNEIDRHPMWSSDGQSIAFLIGRAGEGRLGLYHLERGAVSELGGGLNITRFAWSDDDDALLAVSSPSETTLAARARRHREDGFVIDDDYAPLYAPLPAAFIEGDRQTWRVNARTGEALSAAPEVFADQAQLGTGANAAGGAYALPLEGPGDPAYTPRQVRLRDGAGAEIVCGLSECIGDILAVWPSADRASVLFQRREGSGSEMAAFYQWRPVSNEVRLIHRGEEVDFDCALLDEAIVCLHETSAAPRRVVRIDIATGAISTLYDPNPNWSRFRVPRVERLDARDQYGEPTYAHLVYPADYDPARTYPIVVVQYRSRGFLRGGTGNEYPIWPLAARGNFVLSVSRPEPLTLRATLTSDELIRRTALDDAENLMKHSGLEQLLSQAFVRASIDQRRVAITGLSDGAETAFYEITHFSRYTLALTGSAPTDALDWSLNSNTFRRAQSRALRVTWPDPEGGLEWSSWWSDNSAALFAPNIEAPLLMQLTDSEALSAFPLYARLRELERPVELIIYPGEYHLKWRPRHIALQQIRALDWIDFWFHGVEREDPVDPDRLIRWRRLRQQSLADADTAPPARTGR